VTILALLARFWKPLACLALVIGAWALAHHQGYESGYAASEAKWQPAFAAAERARDAANAVARQKEASSTALSQQAEVDHEKAVASLTLRAHDADERIRDLVRQLAASASRGRVPTLSGPATVITGPAESDQRASEAGGSIARTGADCEADAITLAGLQRWVTEQRAIANVSQ
jgi:hypothetical protein